MKLLLLILSVGSILGNSQAQQIQSGDIPNIPSSSFVDLIVKGDKDVEIVKKILTSFLEKKKRFIASAEKRKSLLADVFKEAMRKTNQRFPNGGTDQQIEAYNKKILSDVQPVYYYLFIKYTANFERADTLFASSLEWNAIPVKFNLPASDINLATKKQVDVEYLQKTPLLVILEQILTLLTQKNNP